MLTKVISFWRVAAATMVNGFTGNKQMPTLPLCTDFSGYQVNIYLSGNNYVPMTTMHIHINISINAQLPKSCHT